MSPISKFVAFTLMSLMSLMSIQEKSETFKCSLLLNYTNVVHIHSVWMFIHGKIVYCLIQFVTEHVFHLTIVLSLCSWCSFVTSAYQFLYSATKIHHGRLFLSNEKLLRVKIFNWRLLIKHNNPTLIVFFSSFVLSLLSSDYNLFFTKV